MGLLSHGRSQGFKSLTSTLEESRSAGLFDFVGEGHIDGDADWTGFARPNRSDIFEDVTGDTG
jgi:hypothetical protein